MLADAAPLTDRQQRERDYHRDYAARQRARIDQDVATDIISPGPRRWWNAFWCTYDRLLAHGVAGRRVLVPGCGFGEDAIRLGYLGAAVWAFDISPDSIDIARRRAARLGQGAIEFRVMPAEQLDYPSDYFDLVVFIDMLHHVDIDATLREVRRVLRPGGTVIGDELYTHSLLQYFRESRIVARCLYPLLRRWIYGTDCPYITADEHKIDEYEFALVLNALAGAEVDYFGVLEGRMFPNRIAWAARLDRLAMRAVGQGLGHVVGGRVVFSGKMRKEK
jgi:ubiquinone/menaquinone biosynthesis C-methylase UbiE